MATRFAQFITPGDVLARTFTALGRLGEPSAPAPPQVGQGQPGNERAFAAAYQAAGGHAVLGDATSEVYDEGPGWVQHFAGAAGQPPAVLCACYEHEVVAIDARVWDAIGAAGAPDWFPRPRMTSKTVPTNLLDSGSPLVRLRPPGRRARARMRRQP